MDKIEEFQASARVFRMNSYDQKIEAGFTRRIGVGAALVHLTDGAGSKFAWIDSHNHSRMCTLLQFEEYGGRPLEFDSWVEALSYCMRRDGELAPRRFWARLNDNGNLEFWGYDP